MIRRLAAVMTAAVLCLATVACTGVIVDEMPGEGGGGPGDDPGDSPDDPRGQAACVGEGGAGGACEVSADCDAPLVCLDGACVGPKDPTVSCDAVEGQACADPAEVCVAGLCVIKPASCQSVDECPLGYLCQASACVPAVDGQACTTPGPGPALAGTWRFDSTLHLRDALPGAVDLILSVSQRARDIINGDIDLGLPSLVESVIGGIVSSIVRQYIPPWGQNLAIALGDISDMIDDMRVESTVTLTGQACDGTYRGTQRWDFITFDFRGQQLRIPPSRLPGVTEIVTEDFVAIYSCGQLYIDRHRIKGQLAELVRFLVDTAAQGATGYPDMETALSNLVDCYGVALAVDDYVYQVCSFCPVVVGVANSACNVLVDQAIQQLSQAVDDAAVKLSMVKLKGTATVPADGRSLGAGRWFGSLVGGDFPGEFQATRK